MTAAFSGQVAGAVSRDQGDDEQDDEGERQGRFPNQSLPIFTFRIVAVSKILKSDAAIDHKGLASGVAALIAGEMNG